MSINCPTCGQTFSGTRGMRVHHAHTHDERLPNCECANCGASFYSETERKYCSSGCRDESVSFEGASNPNYQGGKETTDCEICGEMFTYYPSEKSSKYCATCVKEENWRPRPDVTGADHPNWNGGKKTLTCEVCDESFERYPSNVTGEVSLCGKECQQEWLSEAFTGDGHPNWEGGDTGAYGPGWNRVRRTALKRDGYGCVVCGRSKAEIGRNPDVHHITPVRVFAESDDHDIADAHELTNVVSLCIGCHRKAEFGQIEKARLRKIVQHKPSPGQNI